MELLLSFHQWGLCGAGPGAKLCSALMSRPCPSTGSPGDLPGLQDWSLQTPEPVSQQMAFPLSWEPRLSFMPNFMQAANCPFADASVGPVLSSHRLCAPCLPYLGFIYAYSLRLRKGHCFLQLSLSSERAPSLEIWALAQSHPWGYVPMGLSSHLHDASENLQDFPPCFHPSDRNWVQRLGLWETNWVILTVPFFK